MQSIKNTFENVVVIKAAAAASVVRLLLDACDTHKTFAHRPLKENGINRCKLLLRLSVRVFFCSIFL